MKKICILSIFGGGVRSVFSAMVLQELESRLNKKSAQKIRLIDYFDLVAGTSIGGLIAALILSPVDKNNKPYTMSTIYELVCQSMIESSFFDLKTNKSMRNPDYSSKRFIQCMCDIFTDLEVRDFIKPSLITAYEPNRNWLAFFKQHHAKILPEYNFYVKDAIAATCAMPFYFNPVTVKSFSDKKVRESSFIDVLKNLNDRNHIIEILKENKIISDDGMIKLDINLTERKSLHLPSQYSLYQHNIYEIIERIQNPDMTFLDGALFSNNPSMSALIEANVMNNNSDSKEVILVSLGNGRSQVYKPYSSDIDKRFASQLLGRLFSCSEKLGYFQTFHALNLLGQSENYYHFSPIIDSSVNDEINDTRKSNFLALEKVAKNYIKQISEHLDQLVDKLLD
ncbi:MAG: hypothetical protein EP298_08130 [Gammaproteobacteria bacterium]|nr:MAG: hypothetical protein EP298_08130 [Gammaproteobacteria bacterium]UTW42905.1 patatin-like phospholipase family protein [bacterium SCSIO 12844]